MTTPDDTVPLDKPITLGGTEIKAVAVRKPDAGELRGVKLRDLMDLDVESLIKVLPRVTAPTLPAAIVATIDPADLTAMGSKVAAFLLPKAMRQSGTD